MTQKKCSYQKNNYRAFLLRFFADKSQNKQKQKRHRKKNAAFLVQKVPVPTLFGQQIRGVQPGFGDKCIDGLAQAGAFQKGSTEIEMSHGNFPWNPGCLLGILLIV